ncbi:dihydroneopterin aldolase [Renibacterium salmoninarum ATCC 33209]|uniref:7,8-dihydroneopterin aldolase n=1 Tax=Renibacterium salmoninarum (strain ATCC 33209 / DSM 20767 / JCM 11484 / NBRC 15589 / NCIMB 2235) TaxID=288705 RepID=A9WUQ8_RENSM|nr:dihydroneopterin aldolase [Renibacterium salmoninarum]ABY24929.1 dihydroneopterin aldolase [Renibacterium salmoninarum ATCC 33209]
MAAKALNRPDRITLTGVSAIGHHGVFEREKRDGQPFIVDAVLFTDVRPASANDELEKTSNYAEVAEEIKAMITGEPFDLIETLAERTAQKLLKEFAVDAVEITVHKPKAPIQVPFGDVSVTLYRERT